MAHYRSRVVGDGSGGCVGRGRGRQQSGDIRRSSVGSHHLCVYTRLPIVLPFGRPEIRSRASSSLRSRCQRGNTARPSVRLSVSLHSSAAAAAALLLLPTRPIRQTKTVNLSSQLHNLSRFLAIFSKFYTLCFFIDSFILVGIFWCSPKVFFKLMLFL